MSDTTVNEASQRTSSPMSRVLSAAIKKMIKYDHQAIKKLKPLAGKKVKIIIQPVNQSMVLLIHKDTIEISTDDQIEADTTISGKPSSLFAMSTNQHIPGLDGVTINGDATTGQFIAEFLKQLKPDWEDAWCDLLGEGPGYQVSELLKNFKRAGSNLMASVKQSSHEYLLEESRDLVSAHEMDEFLDQVDDLQSDVTSLSRRLAQQLNQSSSNK